MRIPSEKGYIKIMLNLHNAKMSTSRSFCIECKLPQAEFRQKLYDTLKVTPFTGKLLEGPRSVTERSSTVAIRIGSTVPVRIYVPKIRFAIEVDYVKDWMENVVTKLGFNVIGRDLGIVWMNRNKK